MPSAIAATRCKTEAECGVVPGLRVSSQLEVPVWQLCVSESLKMCAPAVFSYL